MTKEEADELKKSWAETNEQQEEYFKSLQIFNIVNERCRKTKGYEYFEVNDDLVAFHRQNGDKQGETLVCDRKNIVNVWFTLEWEKSEIVLDSILELDVLLEDYGDFLHCALNTDEHRLFIFCEDYEGFYDEIPDLD